MEELRRTIAGKRGLVEYVVATPESLTIWGTRLGVLSERYNALSEKIAVREANGARQCTTDEYKNIRHELYCLANPHNPLSIYHDKKTNPPARCKPTATAG